MKRLTRRIFIRWAEASAAAAAIPSFSPGVSPPREEQASTKERFALGMASYTFRAFNLDAAIAMTKRLGLKRISLKSVHLPLDASPEILAAARARVEEAGISLYSGGVIYMTSEAEVRQAFAYARAAGMGMIIGAPNPELLSVAEARVKETDIHLAIHNHGPTDKLFPTPETVYERIKGLDKRIGLCIDIGHTQRSGVDPAGSAERCFDRLLDVHIKDVTAATAEGGPIEIGRGVINIPRFLGTLIRLGYAGTLSLEYEKDEKDPFPGAAESIGYVKGVLAAL
jgi:sugar phosphate isomerase/epimerase